MLLTYRDAIEHLIDVFNLDGKDVREVSRKVRRSVNEACNKLPALHDWEFLRRTGMFTTTAPQETGTVTYDLATREMTLTDATWPSDVAFGSVIIGVKKYEILRRNSDTVITLDQYQSPQEDYTTAQSYRWVRNRYLLPYDVADISEMTDIQLANRVSRILFEANFWHSEAWNITGSPTAFCFIQSRQRPGLWEIWLSSTPTDPRQFRYSYQPRWAANEVEELSTGTVAITDDVATFSSGILTDNCVGTVLRVSSTASIPTNSIGRYDAATKTFIQNSPVSERVITQVNSTTEAILNQSVTTAVTGKGFTISSLISLNTEGMLEFFNRLCEYQYSIISRADTQVIGTNRSYMLEALKNAMASDARNLESGRQGITYARPLVRN